MNLVQIQERLKDLPLQAIMSYANGQSPQVPPYLALGEMNRRKKMEEQAAQPPKASVKDSLEQQMGMMQMQKMRQGMMAGQPPMQPQAPQAPQPEAMPQPEAEMAMAAGGVARLPVHMDFASGGIIAFANPEGKQLVEDEDKLESDVAKKIMKRIKQREGTEPRDPIDTPAEVDTSIPGFEAGNRFAQEMAKRTPSRPVPPTPQQIEANVARPDMSEQIPGQSYSAPASTGRMPGEVERNVSNTLSAIPGASAAKGFQGGARGVMALIGNLLGGATGGRGGEIPSVGADQNLGSEIMAQAGQPRPQAAIANSGIASVAPVSRPTSQMTPQQMERAMANAAANVASSDQPSVRPPVVGGQRPAAQIPAAAVPAKSAAQIFQENLLAGQGLPALPSEYVPPKQAPIAEDYLKYLSDREQKSREEGIKFDKREQDRARRDFFNSLIEGAESSRGQRGIGALIGGTGKSLGRYATESEDRRVTFEKAQQELLDNNAKTRYEIANLRRAEERGDSKAIYDSRVKIAELNQQRNQLQAQAANSMASNESAERVARANNLTQLEVARLNRASADRPGETERLMTQYAEIKRTKGDAAAEEFMRTIERVKTGSRGETAQQKLNVQRQALAEKLPIYQMAISNYTNAKDPKVKADSLAKIKEIESLHGIKSDEAPSIDTSQWGNLKVK